MNFGQTVASAIITFAITNVDDAFVLATFFAESATSSSSRNDHNALTPLKITIGQYVGFTVIVAISLIGYGVSVVLPYQPIGFLGLLPIVLGFWKLLGLFLDTKGQDEETEEEVESVRRTKGYLRAIAKVALITVVNGGENLGTYVPLFSQAEGAEIAIYLVVYYILLGVWCLVAFLIIRQKHVLAVVHRYADMVIPFLYMGIGVYIVVVSEAYPWAIDKVDDELRTNSGRAILAGVTSAFLLLAIGAMAWIKWRRRRKETGDVLTAEDGDGAGVNDPTSAAATATTTTAPVTDPEIGNAPARDLNYGTMK
ncbi:hypothetical protein F4808DRAFT_198253 [Astrocystis sublimbata]|nr:hypothetical protein F4808DRAFT_198132 [Astrocystis sublimbata]KAI0199998.1 hypothetical protein F4808DRAFT_198253 [Astrocystis sublimbata]